jgi:hypothetical protein
MMSIQAGEEVCVCVWPVVRRVAGKRGRVGAIRLFWTDTSAGQLMKMMIGKKLERHQDVLHTGLVQLIMMVCAQNVYALAV